MDNFLAIIKRDATALITLVTLITAVVGGAITVESRYVKAADFQSYQQQQSKSMNFMYQQQQLSIIDLQKKQLEDKIFELGLEKPSPQQRALMQKYQNDLNDLNLQEQRSRHMQIPGL